MTGTDGQGKTLVVWENGGELWSARLEASRGPTLAAFPIAAGLDPAMAMDEHGKGMLVWMSDPDEGGQLLASGLEAESVSPSQHRLDASGPIRDLQVAMDRRGGAIVLWSQGGPRGWELRVQTYDGRSGFWEANSIQLGPPEPSPSLPCLIMNEKGIAMAIWQASSTAPPSEGDAEGLVVAYNWPHEGIWSDHPICIAARHATELAATLDVRGNALLCWIQHHHGEQAILEASRFSEASCEWSEPCTLARAPGLSQLRMDTDANGDSLVAWRQQESSGNDHILGRRCRMGEWEEHPLRIHAGQEHVRDYALLKRGEQASFLLLPLRGGAVIHQVEGTLWQPPLPLAQDSTEATLHPMLLHHPTGTTALWLSGSQDDTRLMVATDS